MTAEAFGSLSGHGEEWANRRIRLWKGMPRAGFEPAAYSLGGSRSIQLSYRGPVASLGRKSIRPDAHLRILA